PLNIWIGTIQRFDDVGRSGRTSVDIFIRMTVIDQEPQQKAERLSDRLSAPDLSLLIIRCVTHTEVANRIINS
ncbi:Gamma-aminobutyric acid receptor subunit beta-like, partial [Araneus ventricosus]